MPRKQSKQWLCPLCAQVNMVYGTTCTTYPECGNMPHITGRVYVDDNGRISLSSGDSVGIAQISNEDSDGE